MKTLTMNKVLLLLLGGIAFTFASCDKKANEETTEETAMNPESAEKRSAAFDKAAYDNDQKKYTSELDEINAKYPNVYYVYYADPNGWYVTNHGTYSARVYGLDKDAELSKRYNEALKNRYNARAQRANYYSTAYTSVAIPKDGYDKFYETLGNKLAYPSDIQSSEAVEGTVMVEFTVDAAGTVKNVHVVDGLMTADPAIRDRFYKEATEAIQSTNGLWTPAQQGGQAVETDLEIPITFKLS